MPPPAEPFATRILLGPALRTQPDRRLVKLVREGYEAAFEEIVRRYRRPLDRFAAAFVGSRSEDVTQDAFSKALLALRGSEKEIELRPWLYRIVRNTALNDLRDQPQATAELGEATAGGPSAAAEAERRQELRELMERLRALPEPQRAAIVMRELEGLSHEEIAAALGVSGGAARQTIHRARVALRDGFGLLLPLPLLRMLFDHGAEVAGAGAAGTVAAAGAASAGGGAGAALGGLGAGGVLKVGVATALLAGSVGAGVAMQHDRGREGLSQPAAAEASVLRGSRSGALAPSSAKNAGQPTSRLDSNHGRGSGEAGGNDRSQKGSDDDGRSGGRGGHDERGVDDVDDFGHGHGGPGPGEPSDSGGHGSSGGRHSSGDDDSADGHSGEGVSGGSHSGHGGSGSGSGGASGSSGGGSGRDGGGDDHSGGGGEAGGSGHSGSGSGHSGSGSRDDSGGGDPAPVAAPPPPSTPPPTESDEGSDSGGSGSGDDGSGSGSGRDGPGGEIDS